MSTFKRMKVDPYLTPHIKNLDFPGIHELFIDYITDFLLSKARPTLDACILGIKWRSLWNWIQKQHLDENATWHVFLQSSDQKFPQQHSPVCHNCWSQKWPVSSPIFSPPLQFRAIFNHRIRCAPCTIPAEWPEWPNYIIYRWKTWIWAKHLIGPEFLSSWCHPVTKV